MDYQAMVAFFDELRKKIEKQKREERSTAPRFNIYRMFGIERLETEFHSKFLADLLNPAGSHGQVGTTAAMFQGYAPGTKSENKARPSRFWIRVLSGLRRSALWLNPASFR